MAFPPIPVRFAEIHPFEVVNKATGETLSRFSNFSAAMATAKDIAPSFPKGDDVLHEGVTVGRCGGLVRPLGAAPRRS